jgi:F-type H+-transporting ATPase subunit alpha
MLMLLLMLLIGLRLVSFGLNINNFYASSKDSILNKGPRIALRGKVNESIITGLSIVDTILPIGRGQRQLLLGDRNTGKTSLFLNTIIANARSNYLGSIDGFGSNRLMFIYLAINQNLSKLVKFIDYLSPNEFNVNQMSLVLATHASSPAMLGYLLPCVGISIAERLRDRGYDVLISFDDLSKHAKTYRQISLLLGKIPSRDAYPSDIFNVHSSLLERAGKLRLDYGGGSISAFPIIETINSDITEFIATNVISITDGQLYTSKNLFLNGIRPAIDSALSVSRIGSNAQMKFMKLLSGGIKNELTNLRIAAELGNISVLDELKLNYLENVFSQIYLLSNNIETTLLLLLCYKNNMFIDFITLLYKVTFDTMYCSYLMFLCKQNYNESCYRLIVALLNTFNFTALSLFKL